MLQIDTDTKITIFFDSSGSMDTTLAPLQTMRDTLLQDLLIGYYGGNTTIYDAQVTIIEDTSERTFDWLNNQGSALGTKHIILVFQDEASSIYTGGSQPTSQFQTDMVALRTVLAGRTEEDYQAIVFQVQGDANTPAFTTLLENVVAGTSPYDAAADNLSDHPDLFGVTYDVLEADTAAYYAQTIQTALFAADVSVPPPGSINLSPAANPALPTGISLTGPSAPAVPTSVAPTPSTPSTPPEPEELAPQPTPTPPTPIGISPEATPTPDTPASVAPGNPGSPFPVAITEDGATALVNSILADYSPAIELGTNAPNGTVTAKQKSFGQDLDGNIWFKRTGDDNKGWEQFLISEDGKFLVAFELADSGDIVVEDNVLSQLNRRPQLGDEPLAYAYQPRWATRRNPPGVAKFVVGKPSGANITGNIRTSTGYVCVTWWDEPPLVYGSGVPDSSTVISHPVPGFPSAYCDYADKPVTMWSCTGSSDATLSGDITNISFGGQQVYEAYIAGLPALTNLSLLGSNLHHINLDDLPALETLSLQSCDLLREVVLRDLPALQTLSVYRSDNLERVELKNLPALQHFSGYGLPKLKYLDLREAPILENALCQDNPLLEEVILDGLSQLREPRFNLCTNLARVSAVGAQIGNGIGTYYSYALHSTGPYTNVNQTGAFGSTSMTTDALYEMIDGALFDPTNGWITIYNTPASVGGVLQDGVNHTAAEVSALAASKNLTIVIPAAP
ncbi:hypothetical protein [Rubellicoccus peritrichatus]|uniref:Uncharacterized protein n=1 Tax=Rubellicoccus peritrichatus TaxID=3080537 RepID=A0AAQ3LCA4_9BACT|nr:hypothetical protein [Puniceicoccus sp. CR14]WOO43161.1 hypothetical protein RZN69_08650 [Puniceicoccus sp. CR14]